MTDLYPLRSLTRWERVAVHKFGFDREPTILEDMEVMAVKAVNIADLSRDLLTTMREVSGDNGHETEAHNGE